VVEGDGSAGGDPREIGPATRTMIAGLDRDALRASRLGRGEGPVMAERRAMIARLLNAGAPRGVIVETITERFAIAPATAENEIAYVRNERADLFEAERKTLKSEQVARLQRDLAEMRSREGAKPWKSIANHEGLLAKITGTIEPTRVDVSMSLEVTNALAIFVARLGPEEIEAMVAEQACIESGDPLAVPAARMLPMEGPRYAGPNAGWSNVKRPGAS
jgi:hypothetical protein